MQYLTLFFSFILLSSALHAQSDGLLKNGRSVRYTSQKGVWVRALEPEEDEYIQLCVAKVMNSFPKEFSDSYKLIERYSFDTEDILRKRIDDQNKIPYHLKCKLTYQNKEKQKLYVQVDINPIVQSYPTQKVETIENETFGQLFKISEITWKMMNGEKLNGNFYVTFLGNMKSKAQPSFQLQAQEMSKNFLQVHHIVLTVYGEDKAVTNLLNNIDIDRLKRAKQYSEKWP